MNITKTVSHKGQKALAAPSIDEMEKQALSKQLSTALKKTS